MKAVASYYDLHHSDCCVPYTGNPPMYVVGALKIDSVNDELQVSVVHNLDDMRGCDQQLISWIVLSTTTTSWTNEYIVNVCESARQSWQSCLYGETAMQTLPHPLHGEALAWYKPHETGELITVVPRDNAMCFGIPEHHMLTLGVNRLDTSNRPLVNWMLRKTRLTSTTQHVPISTTSAWMPPMTSSMHEIVTTSAIFDGTYSINLGQQLPHELAGASPYDWYNQHTVDALKTTISRANISNQLRQAIRTVNQTSGQMIHANVYNRTILDSAFVLKQISMSGHGEDNAYHALLADLPAFKTLHVSPWTYCIQMGFQEKALQAQGTQRNIDAYREELRNIKDLGESIRVGGEEQSKVQAQRSTPPPHPHHLQTFPSTRRYLRTTYCWTPTSTSQAHITRPKTFVIWHVRASRPSTTSVFPST